MGLSNLSQALMAQYTSAVQAATEKGAASEQPNTAAQVDAMLREAANALDREAHRPQTAAKAKAEQDEAAQGKLLRGMSRHCSCALSPAP